MPSVLVDAVLVDAVLVDAVKDFSGNADDLAESIEGGLDVSLGSSNLLALADRCGARGAILALTDTVAHWCLAARDGAMVAQRQLFASS